MITAKFKWYSVISQQMRAVSFFQFAVRIFQFAVSFFQKYHLLWDDRQPLEITHIRSNEDSK